MAKLKEGRTVSIRPTAHRWQAVRFMVGSVAPSNTITDIRLREYKNGEGSSTGRTYRFLLVPDQAEPVLLRGGRFTLRRERVDEGAIAAAKAAFREYYITEASNGLVNESSTPRESA